MTGEKVSASPSLEKVITVTVGLCGYVGWALGVFVAAWVMARVRPLKLVHFVGAYVLVCVSTWLAAMLFQRIKEAQLAMQKANLAPAKIALGIGLALALASGVVAVTWCFLGFRGLYMLVPVIAAPLGAWLAARIASESGEARAVHAG